MDYIVLYKLYVKLSKLGEFVPRGETLATRLATPGIRQRRCLQAPNWKRLLIGLGSLTVCTDIPVSLSVPTFNILS